MSRVILNGILAVGYILGLAIIWAGFKMLVRDHISPDIGVAATLLGLLVCALLRITAQRLAAPSGAGLLTREEQEP